MKPEITIDPRIEEILRDVTVQPSGTSLLRVPSAEIGRRLSGRAWTVEERSRLLTNAERELVRMHREEVALLLRRAALAGVLAEFDGRVLPLDPADPGPDREQVARKARSLHDAACLPQDAWRGLELLRRAAGPGPRELALASLRLAPSDEARIYLAVALFGQEQPRAAERLLHSVLAGLPTTTNASIAWEDIGLVRDASGNDAGAARAYRRAVQIAPRPLPALLWLRSSARTGQRAEFLECSRWLEDRVRPEDPAYQAFLRYERGVSTDATNPAMHTARALFEELKHDLGGLTQHAVQAVL